MFEEEHHILYLDHGGVIVAIKDTSIPLKILKWVQARWLGQEGGGRGHRRAAPRARVALSPAPGGSRSSQGAAEGAPVAGGLSRGRNVRISQWWAGGSSECPEEQGWQQLHPEGKLRTECPEGAAGRAGAAGRKPVSP